MNESKRKNVLWKISRSVQNNTSCEKIVSKGKIFNIKKKKSLVHLIKLKPSKRISYQFVSKSLGPGKFFQLISGLG